MRQRRYVDDLGHFDTAGVDGADGGFTAVARTLHIYFDLSQTGFQSTLAASSAAVCAAYGVFFLEPLKPIFPAEDPGNDLTCLVGKGNDQDY